VGAALATIALTIGLIVVIRHARNSSGSAAQPDQIAGTQAIQTTPENPTAPQTTQGTKPLNVGVASQPGQAKSPPKSQTLSRNSADQGAVINQSETATEAGAETRTTNAPLTNVTLSAVSKIYVEVVGGNDSNDLREAINERLRSKGQISVVGNRNDADALLQVTSAGGTDTESKIVVELINRRGTVIWSGSSYGKYTGSVPQISANIVKDLRAAMRRSKQQR